MNAAEIEEAISDLVLQPFDAAEFPFAFLTAFGNKDTALKRLRTSSNNTSDLAGGVLGLKPDLNLLDLQAIFANRIKIWSVSISAAVSKTTPSGWKNCLSYIPR